MRMQLWICYCVMVFAEWNSFVFFRALVCDQDESKGWKTH